MAPSLRQNLDLDLDLDQMPIMASSTLLPRGVHLEGSAEEVEEALPPLHIQQRAPPWLLPMAPRAP